MRNILWYYYQIRFDNIKENKNDMIIKNSDAEYIFKELKMSEDSLKQIVNTLYYRQIPTFLIILNKDGEISTKYNNKDYILLKKVPLLMQNIIDLTHIEVKVDRNDIGAIWANKIDYYMLQLKEFGVNKEILINSFNYYVGMAENAIAMANRINASHHEYRYVIQHNRLEYPINFENYYDPTTMVIDVRVRDLSEFIKSKFLNDTITVEEIDKIVKKYDIDEYEINLLYARLFYPTYYFDLFEDMVIDEEDEEKIIRILEKREKYEDLLNKFYEVYKKQYNVFEVEWIKKELWLKF